MSAEKCIVCDETVNDQDETSSAAVDGVWYHNECFKCSQCDEQLLENPYSLSDGNLYCKPHFEETNRNNTRLPRGVSLPKPSELKTTSSKLSSIFFKAQSKRIASKLPPSQTRQVPQTVSNADVDSGYASDAHASTNQTLLSAVGQLDQTTAMDLFMHNPALHGLLAGVSNHTEIGSQDFLRNTLQQLTRNPEMMSAIIQLGQQMEGKQDLGSMFAAMNCSNGGGDPDMFSMFQHMMPLFSQAASSRLLELNRPTKRDLHRRCYSDSASINVYSMDCQMNLKEAAQKISDEYSAVDIFSSVVESAALFHDNVYDIYGLADLCSEEELAEEFMAMLKRDVCRRLGKRYDCCSSVS